MDDDELGLGASVTLRDAFTGTSTRVREEFGRLYQSFRAGSTGIVQALGALAGHSSLVGFALGGPTGVAMGLHQVMRRAVETGSEMENLRISFATMLGSTDAARSHLEELQRFALGKPFEFSQLATASRMLQTYGFAARDVTGLLTDMGDAAFNANTGFVGVMRQVRVFGQIRAAGQITKGHLNQLVASGVDAYAILREQLHLTDAQLQNIARSGIPAQRIIDALRRGMQGRYAGGMDRAAATLSARLSDLSDAMGNVYRDLYEELGPSIGYFVGLVSTTLSEGRGTIVRALSGILNVALGFARIVSGLVGGVFSDTRARWMKDTGGALRGVTDFARRFELVVSGVAALLSSEDGKGISRIPRAMRDRLVNEGLWPTVQAFARFGDRVRAFVGGLVGGLASGFGRSAERMREFARALGLGRWATTREGAERLGRALGELVPRVLQLRAAWLALQAAGKVGSTGLSLARFAAANPILAAVALAVIAIGAASLWAYQHAEKLTSSAPEWRALHAALSLVFGPFIELAIFARRADEVTETWRKRMSGAGKELRDAWGRVKDTIGGALAPVMRVGAAIASAFNVAQAFVVVALYTLGAKVWAFVGSTLARVRAWALELVRPFLAALLSLWAKVKTYARSTFGPYLDAARAIWEHIKGLVVQRAVEMYATLRNRTVGIASALLGLWRQFKEQIATTFAGLGDLLLSPLRSAAREMVSMYRSLPASLQRPELNSMVGTLERFGAGGGAGGAAALSASRSATENATSGASAVRAATTQGAAVNARVQVLGAAAAAREGAREAPAPVVNVAPVMRAELHLDGRRVADAVARQDEEDRMRHGHSVPTAGRNR
jgi:hypothetical protein